MQSGFSKEPTTQRQTGSCWWTWRSSGGTVWLGVSGGWALRLRSASQRSPVFCENLNHLLENPDRSHESKGGEHHGEAGDGKQRRLCGPVTVKQQHEECRGAAVPTTTGGTVPIFSPRERSTSVDAGPLTSLPSKNERAPLFDILRAGRRASPCVCRSSGDKRGYFLITEFDRSNAKPQGSTPVGGCAVISRGARASFRNPVWAPRSFDARDRIDTFACYRARHNGRISNSGPSRAQSVVCHPAFKGAFLRCQHRRRYLHSSTNSARRRAHRMVGRSRDQH